MRHAVAEYDVNVIGLTLSENQYAHAARCSMRSMPRRKEGRNPGAGREFDEPVDRTSLSVRLRFRRRCRAGMLLERATPSRSSNKTRRRGRMLHTITIPTKRKPRAGRRVSDEPKLRFHRSS